MSERLWGILVDSFGKILLPGLTVTIPLTAISFTLALIIAVAVALVQFAHVPVLQRLARFYIWVIRGTPVLVQLFVVFYGLPGVGILIEPFPAAVLVFSINEGAYCAETIRAALESVPKGQMEAGQCVGMSYLQIIRRIILPQALRTAFPTLASTLIAMVKDTSLAANITVTEMFMTTQRIVARTYEPLALYIEVGLVYLLFCTVLTRLQAVGGLQGAALKKVRDDGSGVGRGSGVEKDDRKKARDEVHERPGSEDDQPPPPAFLRERSRIVRLFVLSLHCAEAANRNRAQRIGRFALFLLPKHGPHADGKFVDLYVKQLRREKVPQLMDEDQKAKHQNCE